MAWSVTEIAKILRTEIELTDDDSEIRHLQIDSRVNFPPQKTLFFAIVGEQHDGHDYIPELIQRGYKYFVVERIHPEWKGTFIQVTNSVDALQRVAAEKRSRSNAQVVGITGSNGKTIVKEWANQLITSSFLTVASPRSYNSQVGVPVSVWELKKNTQIGIFEAGISLPGEMNHLQKVIRPEIGVFTTLGAAHDENFTDRAQKLREKVQLFRDSTYVICGVEQGDFQRELKKINPNVTFKTWSIHSNETADVALRFEAAEGSSRVFIEVSGETFETNFSFTDSIAFENLASAITLAIHVGVPMEEIVRGVPLLQPVAMRMQRIRGIEGSTLINDAYNSDTTSLRIALEHLHRDSRDRDRVVILSDILQSGKTPQELYGKIAQWLSRYPISRFYGIGPELTKYRSLFGHQAKFFSDTSSFLKVLNQEDWKDKIILIKGARRFEFEDIVERLEEKEHDTVYEVNLNAVQHNLNVFRKQLRPGVKTMVMVKAMAYGSGYSELARALQFHRVDYLGVAYSDEGIVLRKSGIDTPIMVMNPESDGYRNIIRYRLEPQIYNFRILHRFLEIARAEGVTDYPVHIKLETGMNRLGFQEDELDELIEIIQRQNQISIRALFSHLAASDDPKEDEFTQMQIARFEAMSRKLSSALGIEPMRHLLNSNGIARFADAQFDMVRLGIGLYGFSSDPEVQQQLRNIGRFKTLISQIKTIQPGDTVGYNRKYKAEKESRIATLPVGYADGIPRIYGNGNIRFRSGEYQLPTVGNICMDMCMIDVTETTLKEGDEVVLFETTDDVRQWANVRGTITYEVLTSISERVKRIYIEE